MDKMLLVMVYSSWKWMWTGNLVVNKIAGNSFVSCVSYTCDGEGGKHAGCQKKRETQQQ